MRYYLDTEFAEEPSTIELLSLAIVAEDGRELYAVNKDANLLKCNLWVRKHVLPNLGHPDEVVRDQLGERSHATREQIRKLVLTFIPHAGDDHPEFWGYFADYDWVVFCWLFGSMVELPKHFPYYCRDLKQLADDRSVTKGQLHAAVDSPRDRAHNALSDARWIRRAHQFLLSKDA